MYVLNASPSINKVYYHYHYYYYYIVAVKKDVRLLCPSLSADSIKK